MKMTSRSRRAMGMHSASDLRRQSAFDLEVIREIKGQPVSHDLAQVGAYHLA